ncbi:MAG: dihydroxy-acid dehydratase, partial [Clostridiales bacterium]
ITLNLHAINEISAKTPNLCRLAPAGQHHMQELNQAGGVYAVMHELLNANLLHGQAMTVTGKTVAENIQNCLKSDTAVI